MSYSADTLDLSTLPAAPLVEIDREAIITARKALYAEIWEAARAKNPDLPPFDTLALEYEPVTIASESFAAAETLLLGAINDAGKKLRLAQANGGDLDHLATTYHRTDRKTVRAATAETPAIAETDTAYRERAQLAPEALADMGLTPGGYIYKIRTAFADRIKHVWPINRGNGRVEIRVLGRDGDGTVPALTLAEIIQAFRPEEGQQSTDVLTVLSADILPVTWDVTLFMKRGPDPAQVKALAKDQLTALAAKLHRLNEAHYVEAIASAAHVGPVATVRVDTPAADIAARPEQAVFVASINVGTEVLA